MAWAGRIYVDLDDVLSETVAALIDLLARHFDRRVRVDDVIHFDLGRSFGLDARELSEFMRLVHRPEVLQALRPTPGAAAALGSWRDRGYRVDVMTGRPPSTARASRRWLRSHEIPHTDFACVDKYARPDWNGAPGPALALEALPQLGFDLAVEDSPAMAHHLAEACGLPVALMDRPWNRELPPLSPAAAHRVVRCRSWEEVAERFPAP